MLTFLQFATEARSTFPEAPTGAVVPDNPKLTFRELGPGVYSAHHKGKRVAAAVVTKDLQHGKQSIWKSETHPDYRRKGVMRQLYNHIEGKMGTLHPSSTLSNDGHQFWSHYRPEAVKDDLRNHQHKLMGKEIVHPKYGKGVIHSVGAKGAMATLDSGNTFHVNRDQLKHQLGEAVEAPLGYHVSKAPETTTGHSGLIAPNGDYHHVRNGDVVGIHHKIATHLGFKDEDDAMHHGYVRYRVRLPRNHKGKHEISLSLNPVHKKAVQNAKDVVDRYHGSNHTTYVDTIGPKEATTESENPKDIHRFLNRQSRR